MSKSALINPATSAAFSVAQLNEILRAFVIDVDELHPENPWPCPTSHHIWPL